ncbi:hypothetical protein FHS96_005896 [Sphingomonas zeicaulis]|uniref:DUF6894 family protein n=1 Tax=Sphingomonas zeicaulis TaxID=1632740 RepID=UPI003D25CB16
MARFYLHLIDANDNFLDPTGFDAANSEAALKQCRFAAGQLLLDEIVTGNVRVSFMLCLDDASGNRIATLPVQAMADPIWIKNET